MIMNLRTTDRNLIKCPHENNAPPEVEIKPQRTEQLGLSETLFDVREEGDEAKRQECGSSFLVCLG